MLVISSQAPMQIELSSHAHFERCKEKVHQTESYWEGGHATKIIDSRFRDGTLRPGEPLIIVG